MRYKYFYTLSVKLKNTLDKWQNINVFNNYTSNWFAWSTTLLIQKKI